MKHGLGFDYAGLVAKVASPDVKGILQSLTGAGAIPEDAYRKGLKLHSQLRDTYRRHFREYGIAAIIFPTTPAPAVKIGEDETFMSARSPSWTSCRSISNRPGSSA